MILLYFYFVDKRFSSLEDKFEAGIFSHILQLSNYVTATYRSALIC